VHEHSTFSSVSLQVFSLALMFNFQQGGPCELEVIGKKGMVQLNGRSVSPGTKVPLTGGDEVIFSSCGKHTYVSFYHFWFIQSYNFFSYISFFHDYAL
jgi:hypothetical protein